MNINLPGIKPGSTYESLCKSIGFVILQWGHCEQSLELLVNTLFLQYGGNRLHKRKKMPRQLREKISFVRECAKQIPLLTEFRARLEDLASNFEALAQNRHDLVHGALSDAAHINGVFPFIRLEANPDIDEVKDFKYDLNNFPTFADALLNLGKEAPRLARQVFDARPIQE